MKVKSRLADVDFLFGDVVRKGNTLVIGSHPSQSMKSKVYVTPQDVIAFVGLVLRSPSALVFIIGFPVFYLRARAEAKAKTKRRR